MYTATLRLLHAAVTSPLANVLAPRLWLYRRAVNHNDHFFTPLLSHLYFSWLPV